MPGRRICSHGGGPSASAVGPRGRRWLSLRAKRRTGPGSFRPSERRVEEAADHQSLKDPGKYRDHLYWALIKHSDSGIDLRNNNNNNYDNLYGAVTRPYCYKGASQATKQDKP